MLGPWAGAWLGWLFRSDPPSRRSRGFELSKRSGAPAPHAVRPRPGISRLLARGISHVHVHRHAPAPLTLSCSTSTDPPPRSVLNPTLVTHQPNPTHLFHRTPSPPTTKPSREDFPISFPQQTNLRNPLLNPRSTHPWRRHPTRSCTST
jgi:hypothetical protein